MGLRDKSSTTHLAFWTGREQTRQTSSNMGNARVDDAHDDDDDGEDEVGIDDGWQRGK